MKALTLKHPWPWAICCMGKRIENRTWSPSLRIGERFAIHGGKFPKGYDLLDVADIATQLLGIHGIPKGVKDVVLADVIMAGIVATAVFGGILYHSDDPWFEGPKGWVLRDVIVLPEPIPCRGAQGLWDVPRPMEVYHPRCLPSQGS